MFFSLYVEFFQVCSPFFLKCVHVSVYVGPQRSCLLDLDRFQVDEEKTKKPGCFPAYVDKTDYLAYKYFHFDGEICLCNDEG